MSVQTRLQKRSNRRAVNWRWKDEASFFSDACKKLSRMKSKRFKKSLKSCKGSIKQEPNELLDANLPKINCHYKQNSSGVRKSLFEKLQTIGSLDSSATCNQDPFEFNEQDSPQINLETEDVVENGSHTKNNVENFISEVLVNVKNNVQIFNGDVVNFGSVLSDEVTPSSPIKLFENLPVYGDCSVNNVKKAADEYLESFLSIISPISDAESFNKIFDAVKDQTKIDDSALCSFGDSLFDEGYISKPLEEFYQCPWPSTDRCLLSSEVENKNFGNIFVVRHQKRPRQEESSKRRRSFMFSQPPKYITPVEYHNRAMEHIEHMERRRWQNIVKSHDYEGFYNGSAPTKIPDYIYHNETKHALSTNSELLTYMKNKLNSFTEDIWRRVDSIAKSSPAPFLELSPIHVDHFFCQFFFFSAGFSRQSRKRKRNYLLRYFQPELYMPHYTTALLKDEERVERSDESCSIQKVVRESVPTLPDIPTRACIITSSRSPELRTVENVYSFKRRKLD